MVTGPEDLVAVVDPLVPLEPQPATSTPAAASATVPSKRPLTLMALLT